MEENLNVEQNMSVEPSNIETNTSNNLNNKGSNKGLIIVIALLILVIAGLLVYMFVIRGDDKDKSKNNSNNNNNNNSNEVINTDGNENESKQDVTELSADVKNEIYSFIDKYELYSFAGKQNGVFTKDNDRLVLNAIYYLQDVNDSFDDYKGEDIRNYLKDAFGIQNIELKDIICQLDDEVLYKYLADEDKYVLSEDHPGHGGEAIVNDLAHKIVNAYSDGDKYVIDVVYLWGGVLEPGIFINDTAIDEETAGISGELDSEQTISKYIEYFNAHYSEYTDKNLYEFTIKKNNGKFYLYSLKTVKK
ncbi:MAG: hypothetical protein J5634_04140 [Bacilli bacterium]|nr:hypothetical protein [Bacilli bacterium]